MKWWMLAVAVLVFAALIALHFVCVSGCIRCLPYKKPSEGQIRVACVGDSITFGYLVKPWGTMQYPRQLGRLLGADYCVNNYGYSGRTASLTGDCPYENEAEYRESLKFAPDIVVLMLGTNDSKPYNWKGAEAYKEDVRRLINAYRSLESRPEILLMLPPPCWPVNGVVGYDINDEIIANEIVPSLLQLASEEGVGTVDLFSTFSGHPELFADGVHPNAEGAGLLAKTVSDIIRTEGENR